MRDALSLCPWLAESRHGHHSLIHSAQKDIVDAEELLQRRGGRRHAQKQPTLPYPTTTPLTHQRQTLQRPLLRASVRRTWPRGPPPGVLPDPPKLNSQTSCQPCSDPSLPRARPGVLASDAPPPDVPGVRLPRGLPPGVLSAQGPPAGEATGGDSSTPELQRRQGGEGRSGLGLAGHLQAARRLVSRVRADRGAPGLQTESRLGFAGNTGRQRLGKTGPAHHTPDALLDAPGGRNRICGSRRWVRCRRCCRSRLRQGRRRCRGCGRPQASCGSGRPLESGRRGGRPAPQP